MSQAIVQQNVLLISENKLKSFTDIDPNVTSSVLLPFIGVVQQTVLEYIIGRPFYTQLLQQVQDNTISANTVNYNFLNYFCQPLLIWAAYAEALPSIFMRIKNNGIVNGSDKTVTISEMTWMAKNATDRSQFFQERMRQEIIFNSNFYPLCFNFTSTQGLFPHLTKNYFSGVYLNNGHGDNAGMMYGWAKSGIGYYSGPEFACINGGCF
jgi:hypothetical protein